MTSLDHNGTGSHSETEQDDERVRRLACQCGRDDGRRIEGDGNGREEQKCVKQKTVKRK